MKVLHLHSGLLLGAGIERIIVDLMTRNKEVSNYLCVINNKWSKEYLEMVDNDTMLLCGRREGTRNPLENLSVMYKIYKFIKKNNIDIIHCHNPFSLKFSYLFKKILKIKVVFTVHDINVYNEKLNRYPADKYIAISQSVYNNINNYVPKDKIELVYNGVNLEKFSNSSELLDRSDKIFNIACVARIMPEKKGQDILIKALDILKNRFKYDNFKCFFAGAITNLESMNDLKEIIRQFDLDSNIEFMGNVEKVEKLYANTDVFVLPSRYEGFGLVVVEALAAGCSVVVSKLDGPLEIVKENEEYGLYFEKENYQELAEKLHRLISDVDYRRKYRDNKNTMEYLKREYSLEKMIERYNKIYREV